MSVNDIKKPFLSLVSICGEYSYDNRDLIIQYLGTTEKYMANMISELVREGIVKTVYKDKLKSYRLTGRGKKLQKEGNRIRFEKYLNGTVDTNKVSSDIKRRKRLITLSEVITLLYCADVLIFDDEKPAVFPLNFEEDSFPGALAPAPLDDIENVSDEQRLGSGILSSSASSPSASFVPPIIERPVYISTREYKRAGKWKGSGEYGEHESKVIKGSRVSGFLLTKGYVFSIYNTRDSIITWAPDVEIKWKAELENGLCNSLLKEQYHGKKAGGILIGKGLETLEIYLTERMTLESTVRFFSGLYKPLHYITHDKYGVTQLKFLTQPELYDDLKQRVLGRMKPVDKNYPIDCDAIMPDGRPALLVVMPDIPRLIRFMGGLKEQDKAGVVLGMDYQQEVLSRLLGDHVEFKPVEYERIVSRYFSKEQKE